MQYRNVLLVIALLFCGMTVASAQIRVPTRVPSNNATPPSGGSAAASDRRTVEVTGEAEIRVVPDEAVFNFGIETSSKDINEARSENDQKIKDLLALVRRMGIKEEHIQTDFLNIEPRYQYREQGRDFLGYYTTRNVTVTLRDLSKFDELLSQALKLGVNYVGQAQFRTTKLREHRDEARAQAARAAKEKAEALARELGMRIGKPVTISEGTVWDVIPVTRRGAMQNTITEEAGGGAGGSTIAPGQIAVTARVSVAFEMF